MAFYFDHLQVARPRKQLSQRALTLWTRYDIPLMVFAMRRPAVPEPIRYERARGYVGQATRRKSPVVWR